MKKLLFIALFLPFIGGSGFKRAYNSSTINIADVRTGKWPISLEKWIGHRDTAFVLLFRDQQVMDAEVMDTLPFRNLEQLRYFDKAFSGLNNDGDQADFKDFSIKRTDKKYVPTSFLLRYQEGSTEFGLPEVGILRGSIKKL